MSAATTVSFNGFHRDVFGWDDWAEPCLCCGAIVYKNIEDFKKGATRATYHGVLFFVGKEDFSNDLPKNVQTFQLGPNEFLHVVIKNEDE